MRHVPACRGYSIACSVRAGPRLDCRPASATAKTSMTKRIRMSEAVQQAKCAKPRVNHAWIAGFVAINRHWAKMAAKLISINDSIGECRCRFKLREFYLGNVGSNWTTRWGLIRQTFIVEGRYRPLSLKGGKDD